MSGSLCELNAGDAPLEGEDGLSNGTVERNFMPLAPPPPHFSTEFSSGMLRHARMKGREPIEYVKSVLK